jgi:hypothetical protein
MPPQQWGIVIGIRQQFTLIRKQAKWCKCFRQQIIISGAANGIEMSLHLSDPVLQSASNGVEQLISSLSGLLNSARIDTD